MKPIGLYWIGRNLGLRGLALRASYILFAKTRRIQSRTRKDTWAAYFANHTDSIPTDLSAIKAPFGSPTHEYCSKSNGNVLDRAQDLRQGRLTFFSHQQFDLGYPFAWHKSPHTGKVLPADKHWSQIPDFDPAIGDIKYLWEPSRFGWAYDLVRAYHFTGNEEYPETFWKLFEDWLVHNQPNCGVNWKCSQEAGIRAMALCFALANFWNSPSSTGERKTKLVLALRFHSERIMATRIYALSQNNNHALSEAAGLLTIGALFPFFPESKKWFRTGLKQFCNEIMRQVYTDGAYIQHSFNYHRLMLQLATWVDCILRSTNRTFPAKVRNRLAVSTSFLASFVDQQTGCVPNYGNNDGANILPLSSCDYTDYRPTIQAASIAFLGKPLFAPGPYDEMAYWMKLPALNVEKVNGGKVERESGASSEPIHALPPSSFQPDPSSEPIQPLSLSPFQPSTISASQQLNDSTPPLRSTSQQLNNSTSPFPAGGYYLLRKGKYSIFTRCHSYKHRPGHADALHVDIWRNGQCVFGDSGTFSYLCGPKDDFSTTASHNTIRIGDQDQMIRISRFMWGGWAKAGVTSLVENENYLLWEGWHTGYLRRFGVTHRRAIFLPTQESAGIIVDKTEGDRPFDFELLWHMHATGNEDWLQCHIREGKSHWSPLELSTSVGQHATYYGCKEEHKLLSVKKNAATPTTIISVIGHDPALKTTVAQNAQAGLEHFKILPLLNDCEKGPIFRKNA